jgi:hypothetical protein
LLTADDDRLAADALAVQIAAGGAAGMEAALKLARLVGEAAEPAAALAALDRYAGDTADAAVMAAGLVVACFAAARADYPATQDAIAARTRLAARADAAYPQVSAAGAEVLDWLVRRGGGQLIPTAC